VASPVNVTSLGRLSQWLVPVAEASGVAESGGGKHWAQAVCNAALANNEDLAKALASHLPDGAVSVADIEKMLEPSSYTGGAASIVAAVDSRYRKCSS